MLLTLVFLGTPEAQGKVPAELIEVVEPKGCLNRARLSHLVSEYLQTTEAPSKLGVRVRGGENPGFVVNREGVQVAERRFERLPESCDARHDAFALAIALAIEHALAREHVEETPDVAAKSIAREEPAPAPTAEEREDARLDGAFSSSAAQNSLAYRFSLGGGALAGVLPEPALFASLSADILFASDFSVGLGFLYSSKVRTEFEVGSALSMMVAGSVRSCFEPQTGSFSLNTCLGLSLGRMNAEGQGLWQATEGGSYWVATLTHLGLRYPVQSRFGVHAGFDIFFNLLRPGVQDRAEGGQEESAPPIGGAGTLDLFVVFE